MDVKHICCLDDLEKYNVHLQTPETKEKCADADRLSYSLHECIRPLWKLRFFSSVVKAAGCDPGGKASSSAQPREVSSLLLSPHRLAEPAPELSRALYNLPTDRAQWNLERRNKPSRMKIKCFRLFEHMMRNCTVAKAEKEHWHYKSKYCGFIMLELWLLCHPESTICAFFI